MKTIPKLLLGLLLALPMLATAKSTFDIAHFREQNNDLIMVIVPNKFDNFATSDKKQVFGELQKCAKEAGISGTPVMVWTKPNGKLGSYGPTQWAPYLKSINMKYVKAHVNKEMTCD